jgi:hypothetical protein
MLLYNIVEERVFTEEFDELVKQYPRLDEIKRGLDFLLSHRPFEIGAPIPKNPKSAYGAYFVCQSDSFDRFSYPSFKFYYRISDDTVYLIGIVETY